ncbi:MAG: DUF4214 domain-containing protein [Gammaproteobacteria bacterium]|jgi:hypothetical protein|nr:DUF4214 domain-containing protein [Gammaproteobacteria bacterium]
MSQTEPQAPPPLNVDALIARIQTEAAADEGRTLGVADAPAPAADARRAEPQPVPTPAIATPAAKAAAPAAIATPLEPLSLPALVPESDAGGTVCLGDLLSPPDDAEFLTGAYRALLGREPDATGTQGYGHYLRNGGSRLAVLYALRQSPEGKRCGRPLDAAPWGVLYRLTPVKRVLAPWLRRAERSYLRRHPEHLARQAALSLARQLDDRHRQLENWAAQMLAEAAAHQSAQTQSEQRLAQQEQGLAGLQRLGEHWGGAIERLREDAQHRASEIEWLREDAQHRASEIERLRQDAERWSGAIEQLRREDAQRAEVLGQFQHEQARLASEQEHLRTTTCAVMAATYPTGCWRPRPPWPSCAVAPNGCNGSSTSSKLGSMGCKPPLRARRTPSPRRSRVASA